MDGARAMLAAWALLCAAAPPVVVRAARAGFAPAADEYRAAMGARGRADRRRAGGGERLRFPATPVEAIVRDGPPMTGYDGRSMRLRGAYSPA